MTRTGPPSGSRGGLLPSAARTLFGALVLALAAIPSACGGQGGAGERAGAMPAGALRGSGGTGATPAALSVVRAAAAATLARTTGVRFTLDGSQALGSSSAPVLGSGEFDFRSGMGSEAIDLGEVGGQEPGNEQVVFLPSRVYLQPKAPTTTVMPKGKAWVSATLTGPDSVNTNFPAFVLQVEGINPQLLLTQLSAGSIAATVAGRQAIDGVRARAYEVTVDLTRSLRALRGPTSPVFGQAIRSELSALGAAGRDGGQRTSIRAWIDGAGRLIRLRASPPGAGLGTVTMTICCPGSAVEVLQPPQSQTVDIASLTPSGERENNGGGDSDGG